MPSTAKWWIVTFNMSDEYLSSRYFLFDARLIHIHFVIIRSMDSMKYHYIFKCAVWWFFHLVDSHSKYNNNNNKNKNIRTRVKFTLSMMTTRSNLFVSKWDIWSKFIFETNWKRKTKTKKQKNRKRNDENRETIRIRWIEKQVKLFNHSTNAILSFNSFHLRLRLLLYVFI